MKFLVLGATGRTGTLFLQQALDAGHEVTALVRRPDADVDPRAEVVVGSTTDADAIANAARGHDAIISALGVKSAHRTPTLITDTVRAVIASAATSGVTRFVIVSAFGVGDSLAQASWLTAPLFRTMLRATYADKATSEVLLRESDLEWTLEYPGALTDKDAAAFTATRLEEAGKLPLFPTTSRVNVARFLLRSATEGSFVRETALVLDAK